MAPMITRRAGIPSEGEVEPDTAMFPDDWPVREGALPPRFQTGAALGVLASDGRQTFFEAVRAERTRLAGELHDTLVQSFAGVILHLQVLRRRMQAAPGEVERDLGRLLEIAAVALRSARLAISDMRAPELEEHDLAGALEVSAREAVASHQLAGGARVDLEVTITGERRRLSPAIETAAHRIGREAVWNALRHADARQIGVLISFEPEQLRIEVRDDGVGFDLSRFRPEDGQGHWGLVGMRERAAKARGTLDIRTAPRSGTMVALQVPVECPSRPAW